MALADLDNAVVAGRALYQASAGRITQEALAIMLAVAGQQSNWQSVVQPGGAIGDPLVGVGIWQITPGTEADLDPLVNAQSAWWLMRRDPANPYEPWNLRADGHTLIWATGTLPGGATVAENPPSEYQYEVGAQAAALAWPQPTVEDNMLLLVRNPSVAEGGTPIRLPDGKVIEPETICLCDASGAVNLGSDWPVVQEAFPNAKVINKATLLERFASIALH